MLDSILCRNDEIPSSKNGCKLQVHLSLSLPAVSRNSFERSFDEDDRDQWGEVKRNIRAKGVPEAVGVHWEIQ